MASFSYKKIHVNIFDRRTTININVVLAALLLKKVTGEKADSMNLTDTNISALRKTIQREIDRQNANPNTSEFKQHYLKERVETWMIKQIADPKLLK